MTDNDSPRKQPARQTLVDVMHLPRESWQPCGRRSDYLAGDVVFMENPFSPKLPDDPEAWALAVVLSSDARNYQRTGVPVFMPAEARILYPAFNVTQPVIMGDRAVRAANWTQAAVLARVALRKAAGFKAVEDANQWYNPFPQPAVVGYRAASRHACAMASFPIFMGVPFPQHFGWSLLEYMMLLEVEGWTVRQVAELASAAYGMEMWRTVDWCHDILGMIRATTPEANVRFASPL